MPICRVDRFVILLVFGMFLAGETALWAQGPGMPSVPRPGPSMPSRPSPSGYRPSPGYNRPSPGYNRPSPGRPSPQYPSPGNRYNPSANRPGQPGYRPGGSSSFGGNYSAPTSRPFTSFAPPRPQVPTPGQAYAPRIYAAPVAPTSGGQWQEAQRHLQSQNFSAAKRAIDQHLNKNRSLDGLMTAVSVMEQAGAPRSTITTYRNEAYKLAQQQIDRGANNPMPWVTVAKFSLEDQNDARFNQATEALNKRFPNSEYSHYFNGMKAIKNEDWKTAEKELQKAKELGLPNDAVAEWLKLVIDRQKIIWDFAYYTVYAIIGWVAGMALLYVLGKFLSALTLRSIRNGYTDRITFPQRVLRMTYRVVVGLAGIYYFLSLPILLLLSIALPLSIGYALLMVPGLNLYLIVLVLLAGGGGLITAVSAIGACFVRPQPVDDDAPRLTRDDNPQIWNLVTEVADKVGTRTVDEIVLVAGTEIGVCELGGYFKTLADRGKRVLILGAAALEGLTLGAFRAVLAHEFGHFLNRDTAGGRMTLHVNRAIDNFAAALMARRKIRRWDLGIHFLRFYYALYTRLTFGASRLQELHSDFVAAKAYGPIAFRRGLAHAVRRSVEFDSQLDRAFDRTVLNGAAPLSFYGRTARIDLDRFEDVEATIGIILNSPSTEHDTHPSPVERFSIIRKSGLTDPQSDPETDNRMVLDLLANLEQLLDTAASQIRSAMEEGATNLKRDTGQLLHELNKILKMNYTADVFRFERAFVYFRLKRYDEALKDLAVLIEDRYDRSFPPDIFLLRAEIYRNLGDYAQAATALVLLMKKTSISDVGVYCNLGSCYMRLGQYKEAARTYGRALMLDGKLLPALLGRGRAYQKLNMTEEAEKDFAKARRHYPIMIGPYGPKSLVVQGLHVDKEPNATPAETKMIDGKKNP